MRWLLGVLVLVVGVAVGQAPQICRIQGGNTKTIWGIGFADGQVEAYAWDVPFDEKSVSSQHFRKLPIAPKTFSQKLHHRTPAKSPS